MNEWSPLTDEQKLARKAQFIDSQTWGADAQTADAETAAAQTAAAHGWDEQAWSRQDWNAPSRNAPSQDAPSWDAPSWDAERWDAPPLTEQPGDAAPSEAALTDAATPTPAPTATPDRKHKLGALELLVAGLLLLFLGHQWVSGLLQSQRLDAWATVFVAICVQATPFLVLGTVISAAIAALVPASFLERALPRNPALAVPVAGVAGVILPGCECASVPVAGGLIARGVAPAAALAFLLSAPAINPVVLTATAVAFPGHPEMVLARLGASLGAALVMGWLWVAFGRPEWLKPTTRPITPDESGRWAAFRAALEHDFLMSGGFLVIGGLTAATLNVVVPRQILTGLAGLPVVSILVMALLAVVLAVCSEADAFVAASLTAFSPTARLAFMVVGPMVDVKLVALQAGTFGRAFAWRFSSVTFVVAVLSAALVGWLVL